MSLYSQQNINFESYFQLIIDNLITLNNKIEQLEEKINEIKVKDTKTIYNNLQNETYDWESVLYY